MKNLVKLKVILLVFAIIFASKSIAADKILPLPKPSVDKDTIIKSSKKKEIYPKKKPTKEKIETNVEVAETIETTDKEIFILPVKILIFLHTSQETSLPLSQFFSSTKMFPPAEKSGIVVAAPAGTFLFQTNND